MKRTDRQHLCRLGLASGLATPLPVKFAVEEDLGLATPLPVRIFAVDDLGPATPLPVGFLLLGWQLLCQSSLSLKVSDRQHLCRSGLASGLATPLSVKYSALNFSDRQHLCRSDFFCFFCLLLLRPSPYWIVYQGQIKA